MSSGRANNSSHTIRAAPISPARSSRSESLPDGTSLRDVDTFAVNHVAMATKRVEFQTKFAEAMEAGR